MKFVTSLLLFSWVLPVAVSAQPLLVRLESLELIRGGKERLLVLVENVPEQAELRAIATEGTLQGLDERSGTSRRVQWLPPTSRAPMEVTLAFWISTAKAPEITTARFVVIGRTDLEVNTEPNAWVRVQVAKKTFGPKRADGSGFAVVPIEVPPGTRTARVLADVGGTQTLRTVALLQPPDRFAAVDFSTPGLAPRKTLHAVVVQTGGSKKEPFTLESHGAKASGFDTNRPASVVKLQPEPTASTVTVRLRVKGATEPSAEATVALAESLPPEPEPGPESSLSDAQLPLRRRFSVGVILGGFTVGGSNAGLLAELQGGYTVPKWSRRVTVELFVGIRTLGLSSFIEPLGTLSSSVLALPVGLAGRVRVFEHQRFGLYARLAVAMSPFLHNVRSDFQPGLTERGLGYEANLAVQAAYSLGGWMPFVELRGGYGELRTPQLDAKTGGFSGGVGLRYRFGGDQP